MLTAAILTALSALAILSQNNISAVYAGGEFSPVADFTYNAEKEAAYSSVTFEYKITSEDGSAFSLCVLDSGWSNYFGYFEFGKSGATDNYDGVMTESKDNGFIGVRISFASVTKISGERPQKTSILYIRGDYTTAGGILRNISFNMRDYEETDGSASDLGKKYIAGRNASIYAPMTKLYDKVVFEYKVAKIGETDSFGVCLLDADNNYYFGYYYFSTQGIIEGGYKNDGVKVTELEDGFFRVVMEVAELNRTNQINNRKKAPKNISRIFLRDEWMKDSVYLRNVEFIESKGFSMESGAAIKLEKPYAIKFRASIPRSEYDESALYGMAIFPAEYIVKFSLTENYVGVMKQRGLSFKNAYLKAKMDDKNDYYVESYLKDIGENDIDTEYVGVAYKIIGSTYYYAANVDGCKRSVKAVSEKAIKDPDGFTDYSISGQNIIRELDGCFIEAGANFNVSGFDSLENFKKDDVIPSGEVLTLSAAKGERESGEIVLTATSAVVGETYLVTAYDLVHEDGVTILSKDNISLFNGHYIPINSNYVYTGSDSTNLGTGYHLLDALVPFDAAVKANETVFDQTGGLNRTVYVDISVPEKQKTGVYYGSFIVDVPGVGHKELPVTFTVYDFTLPKENNAKTSFCITTDTLRNTFGQDSGYSTQLYKDIYDFLLEFNVNGGRIPEVPVYGDFGWKSYLDMLIEYTEDPRVASINLYSDFSEVNYTYTYEKKNFLWTTNETKSYDGLCVINEYDRKGSVKDATGNDMDYNAYGMRTILKKIAEYSIENNVDLFEKIMIYLPKNDEPSTDRTYIQAMLSYNAVRRSIDYVLSSAGIDWTGHEDIKASLDDIPYLVTVAPVDSVISGNKLVDNVISSSAYIPADAYNKRVDLTIEYKYLRDFIPLFDYFDASKQSSTASRLTAYLDNDPEHTHVWWYGCCNALNPYQNYGTNSNHVITRGNRWAQFGMGVDGELYYSVNNWRSVSVDETITFFNEDEVWQGKVNQAGLVGDGLFVYPNVDRYEDADFDFCATYRLYVLRESIDDYNYLVYAQKLIDALFDGEQKTRAKATLNDILSSVYSNVRTITDDAATLRNARSRLAALIQEIL